MAEIVGFTYGDHAIFGCYTQSSEAAPQLFSALESIRTSKKFKGKKLAFFMDANAHHKSWLGSKVTDDAGKAAKAFTEEYGMQQFVNFPTRGDNILDLIISDLKVTAKQLPHLGTSDHCNILASIDVSTRMPEPPPGRKVYHWKTASWGRINGALKLALKHWKASDHTTVDAAASNLQDIVMAEVDKYVKTSFPKRSRPAPWWDKRCTKAALAKASAFKHRSADPASYEHACAQLRVRERDAYKRHRRTLAKRLRENKGDADWWHTVKLHAGASTSRTAAAPNAESLADFFAEKLSLDGQEEDTVPDFDVPNPGDLNTFRITLKKVTHILKSLNPNKSVNGISPRVLRECYKVLALPICRLFKKIAHLCVWPSNWKEGRVSAVWKRDSKSDPKNYPITVLTLTIYPLCLRESSMSS